MKGKGKRENYICRERAAVHLLMIALVNCYEGAVPFHFGAKDMKESSARPGGDEFL